MAEEQADVTRAEVLKLLHENTEAAAGFVGSLTDEQLHRTIASQDQEALVPWCGGARTVDELIEHMLIGHIQLHRSSLQAVLGR